MSDWKFRTIVADPPWSYRTPRAGAKGRSGAASKYPVMKLNAIKAIPIDQIAARDAVLFLWATVPMLPEAFEVLAAWGFKYKTSVFWHKVGRFGMGWWFRGAVEVCLVGARGKAKALRCQKPNIIEAWPREHSRKPDEFFDLIDPVTPGPKVELFARAKRDGWFSWGNEINRDFWFAVQEHFGFMEDPAQGLLGLQD